MVSKELLDKFKELYKEKFDTSLSDEEATQMSTDLINLMKVLIEPDPQEYHDNSTEKERRQNETITTPTT